MVNVNYIIACSSFLYKRRFEKNVDNKQMFGLYLYQGKRTYILIGVQIMKKLWNQYSYAIILIVLSCALAFTISIHLHSNDSEHFLKVTVSEGDSIWKISNQFAEQHSLSNNQFVSWVKSHNNIEGDQIFPGEEIIIPVSNDAPSLTEFASVARE